MPGPEGAGTLGDAQSGEPTKRCPYCAEVIKAAAIRCRYCRSDLPADGVTAGEMDAAIAAASDEPPDELPDEPPVEPPVEPVREPAPEDADETSDETGGPLPREPLRRPWVRAVAVVSAVLTLVFLTLAFFDWQKARELAAAEEAGRTVQATVPDKVEALLSYDFSTFDSDLEAAQKGMTESFREEYDPTVQEIRDRALKQRRSQTADVVAVAVLDASAERVRTLVFVDTVSTRANSNKQRVMQNRVSATMVKQGDTWLIDELSVPRS